MSKPHRKSIVREVIERLDSKMAIGESRYQAKVERRAAGERAWTQSTGKIHSFKTRSVYQEHAIRFAKKVGAGRTPFQYTICLSIWHPQN